MDRCLHSIRLNVSGDYEIVIMDDGTPEKYLAKIKKKYPKIKLSLSEHYLEKQNLISTQKEVDGFIIPVKLWRAEVEKSTEYVLVIEDDVWFTSKIDIEKTINEMKSDQTSLVHLGWLGKKDMGGVTEPHNQDLVYYDLSKLFSSGEFVMNLFIYNKYKLFSLLYRLGIVSHQTKAEYWKLNSILMGLWQKDYWLYVWKDSNGKVDEKEQLRNAAVWLNKHKKNKHLIARTSSEFLKTTFQSSATNSYHKGETGFDVHLFNQIINEAWFKDRFDSIQNYPKDFDLEYFDLFLKDKIQTEKFYKWVAEFKNNYLKIGAETN